MPDPKMDATRVETRRRASAASPRDPMTPGALADLRAMADADGAMDETLPVRRDHLRALLAALPLAAESAEVARLSAEARARDLASQWSRDDSPEIEDAPASIYDAIRSLARRCPSAGNDPTWQIAKHRAKGIEHSAIASLGEDTARRVFYGELTRLRAEEVHRGTRAEEITSTKPLIADASPPCAADGGDDVANLRRWAQTVLGACDQADAAAADLARARAVLGLA